tara:strand:- start:25 stop:342 length:318 start_codon:yes stop_codon:yes gene_type:complete
MNNLEIIQQFEEELESHTGLEFTVKPGSNLEHWILNKPSDIGMRVDHIAFNLERRSAKEFYDIYHKDLTISGYEWACFVQDEKEHFRVKGTGLPWAAYDTPAGGA